MIRVCDERECIVKTLLVSSVDVACIFELQSD
jgi:hypothetical protein